MTQLDAVVESFTGTRLSELLTRYIDGKTNGGGNGKGNPRGGDDPGP
jgi:hypothetical protein